VVGLVVYRNYYYPKLFLALGYYGVEARPPGGGWRKPFVR